MLLVVVGTAAIGLWAIAVYLWREQLGVVGLALATFRTVGVAALLVLVANPGSVSRISGGPPIVLLDESLSMSAGGGWTDAVDTALAIAGSGGTILRFGSSVRPFDTLPPAAGASRLRDALYAARALGGPTYVVTDGEIEDLGAIATSMLGDVAFVIVPRDTLTDVALLDVGVPTRVRSDDSVRVNVSVGSWRLAGRSKALLDITLDGHILARSEIDLPVSGSAIRRRISVAPSALPVGTHVLSVHVTADGDEMPLDDTRQQLLSVSEQPAVVVVVDSPDWEGRFLAAEIKQLAGPNVTAFAHATDAEWLDMTTSRRVSGETVRRAAAGASLLVIRGTGEAFRFAGSAGPPRWTWYAGVESNQSLRAGDWYASSNVPASPLAAKLGIVDWDSLPPLVGLLQSPLSDREWVALSARLSRRGSELPVMMGRDSSGRRELTTLASGLWRWRFRGGASLEAYRTLLAAGMDWLLTDVTEDARRLVAEAVVSRGEQLKFRWMREPVPESLVVDFQQVTGDRRSAAVLRFDTQGNAAHELPPGTYQWSVRGEGGLSGISVVEQYSSEFIPRRAVVKPGGDPAATVLVERQARDRWWLFALAVATLAAEWGWRHKRGLV